MSEHARFDVVVGVNGTGSSLYAVKWAAEEAANRGGTLRLVCAWSTSRLAPIRPVRGSTEDTAEITTEGMRLLDVAALVAATVSPGLEVHTELVVGSPPLVLSEASRSADLLVLGDRGPGGCTGMLVGSVAAAVVDLTTCPVLIVRGRVNRTGPVVVGVDGSPSDGLVLAAAFDRAERAGTSVLAIHTWTVPAHLLPTPWGTETRSAQHAARRVLDAALAPFGRSHPMVRVDRYVVTGSPTAALVLASASAQLVVVGSHGASTALRGLLAANACSRDVHHAHCRVEVVRSAA